MICEIVKNYLITSRFGRRDMPPPFDFHRGVDFVSKSGGREVFAPMDGVVTWIFDQYNEAEKFDLNKPSKWGNWCAIKGEINGLEYELSIRHLESVNVELNQKVNAGDLIGKYNNVGWSTGAHVHVSFFYKGKEIDPGFIIADFIPHEKFMELKYGKNT